MKRLLTLAAAGVILLGILTACSPKRIPTGGEPESTAVTEPQMTTTAVTIPPLPVKTTATLFAVGDNLIHSSIYKQAAKRAVDGGYDFDYAYERIKGMVNADINLINQETPIANDIFPPATYPCFNSPTQLGDQMLGLGFNAFNHANNHVLDMGTKGALATLDFWDARRATVCGLYRDEKDRDNIRTKTVNDITFSFLGFAEHTNGLKIPDSSPLEVIYTSEKDLIRQQITAAAKKSDVVVVSVHWGVENSHTVSDAQRALAQDMVNWGADIIIGTHPHVIQSVEELIRENGEKAVVAYSLGNFISAQDVNNRMIGGSLSLSVTKDSGDDSIEIDSIAFVPVITHYDYGFSNVRVYPFSEYTKELAAKHGVNKSSPFSYDFILKTLKDNISEKHLVLT